MEHLEFDNNDYIKLKSEESGENENKEFDNHTIKTKIEKECIEFDRIEYEKFESDTIKMDSGITSEKMQSINNTNFEEEKNIFDDASESHVEIPIEKKTYICEICSKSYKRMLDLSYHMGSAHGDSNAPIKKKSYECSECDYKCSCEANMKKHIQYVHTNERPFLCDLCPKTYKEQRSLNYHVEASHESGNTKQVTCEDCFKIFKSMDTLRPHRRFYHPVSKDNVKYYSCEQCEYKSRYKQNIKIHIKNTHSNERIQCEHCPNTYKSMDSLRYHIGSAHEIGIGIITCDDCGKKCPTKMHLWSHRKRCSNLITKPICDECGITLPSAASVKKHKMSHSGNMNTSGKIGQECNVCFKSFGNRGKLECHMRIHTGERPYSCHICGKAFSQIGHLKGHMKSVHSKERDFICDECDYATVSNYQLKTHKRIHTGYTPYHCEKCAKTFTTQSNLNTHLLIHTGEKKFHCDDCGKAFGRAFTLQVHRKVHTGKKMHISEVAI